MKEKFIGPDRTIEEIVASLVRATLAGEFLDELASLKPNDRATLCASFLEGSPKDQIEEFIDEKEYEGKTEFVEALRQRLVA